MYLLDDSTIGRLGHLNYTEFFRELARQTGPGGVVHEADGLLFASANSTFPVLFNTVVRLDPSIPAAEVVARSDEWFGARGRGYSLNVRVGFDEDDDLREAGEAAGLIDVMNAPEMVCRGRLADRPLADGAELQWVEDRATAVDFLDVSDRAYATIGTPAGAIVEAFAEPLRLLAPHVHCVVAYFDGEPVAAAQVILSHTISGVYWVGTVEAARGKSLGEAVTRAVTNRSFDEGARVATLQASPMGEPIYLRMGYEELYRYATLVRFEPKAS